MFRSSRVLILFATFIFILPGLCLELAQMPAPPATPANLESLQKALAQAKNSFDTNFKEAMEQVGSLIKLLDEAEGARRSISAEEQSVFEEALLLEGRGNLRVLKNDAAREDFRKLLRLNANYTSGTMTPRESQILDDIRQTEMGAIEIQGQPAEATIIVNNQKMGALQPITQKWWFFPGHYAVAIEKPEFAPERFEFDLAAKQTQSFNSVQLLRLNLPLVLFFNQPAAEIWVGDKRVDTSRPLNEVLPSLSLPLSAFAQQQVTAHGWEPANIWAAVLPKFDISTSREILFKKDCFFAETRRIEISPDTLRKLNEQTPLWIDPKVSFIEMRPNRGILAVTSSPSAASVTLDGQTLGLTPLQQTICGGKHDLVVRTVEEGYASSVDVINGSTVSVEARLKPTLAVLPFSGESASSAGGESLGEVSGRLKFVLDNFYVVPVSPVLRDRELQRLNLSATTITEAFRSVNPGGQPLQPVPGALQQVARNLETSLMLLGFLGPVHEGERETTWALLSVDSNLIDVVHARSRSTQELLDTLKTLNDPAQLDEILFQPLLGFRAIDTRFATAPLVAAKIWPSTSAERAGLRGGDIIFSVNGTKVDARQLEELVSKNPVGTRFSLETQTADGRPRTVVIASEKEPAVWSQFLMRDNRFFNHWIARLKDAVQVMPQSPLSNLIRMNLVIGLMRGERWPEALNVLSKITGEFPGSIAGRITGATVQFLMGQCNESLGLKEQAATAYQIAADSRCPSCLVDSTDVDTASAAAERRLNLLRSSPPK